MTNAVAKKEETALTQSQGQTEEILKNDIIIPRLLLAQGLSQAVADAKVAMGDMYRSTTLEKLGNKDKPIQFIPLTYTNTWVLREKVGNKFEFRGTEPMTAANADLEWSFQKNGVDWQRVKSLNLFALLVKDIEAEKAELAKAADGEMPDPDKALMPVLISFQSTGYKAGKTVVTHFAKARKFGVPGHVSVLTLKCYQDKNDKGIFYVFDVGPGGKTPKEFLPDCEYWRGTLAKTPVQVHEEGETTEPGDASLGENSSF